MSKNQNRLINTQRTSVTNKLLKGVGGAILLSILIFGALSVNNQESTAEATSNTSSSSAQAQLTENTSTELASSLSEAESAEVFENQSQAESANLSEAASQSEAAAVEQKASVARTASVTGVNSTASSSSAVQFMAVQTSLNAAGTAGLVKWATAMEQNSKYFEIERSLDGEGFESLGKVNGQGQGVHNGQKDYAFEDISLGLTQMPRVFYRIKQIGLDGKAHLTDMVEHDLNLNLGLYAAIVKEKSTADLLQIRYAGDQEGEMTLRIFKPSGEVLIEETLVSDFVPKMVAVETSGWEKGPYFLQLANDNTTVMEQFEL